MYTRACYSEEQQLFVISRSGNNEKSHNFITTRFLPSVEMTEGSGGGQEEVSAKPNETPPSSSPKR
jgi:hypothetical protein